MVDVIATRQDLQLLEQKLTARINAADPRKKSPAALRDAEGA
jgi:hypothetical protein